MTKRVLVMYAGFVVETAPTAEIFAHPRHPYTVGLLHSLPHFDGSHRQDLVPIEGTPPDQYSPVRGCPFAPRCAWRIAACLRDNPPLAPVTQRGDGGRPAHRLACHNPVTDEEAAVGHPLREYIEPGPMPAGTSAA
jgi:oligopeptide/dipeptide ABC transporter ATP-binding protein